MSYILYVLIDLIIFWTLYLACMNFNTDDRLKNSSGIPKYTGYLILAFSLLVDFLHNLALTFVFLELPKAWLVTDRLKRHVSQDTWRGSIARYLCKNWLSPYDPSGNHCD